MLKLCCWLELNLIKIITGSLLSICDDLPVFFVGDIFLTRFIVQLSWDFVLHLGQHLKSCADSHQNKINAIQTYKKSNEKNCG